MSIGDSELLDELDAAIQPEDRPILTSRPISQADIDAVVGPNNTGPAEMPIEPTPSGPSTGGSGGMAGAAGAAGTGGTADGGTGGTPDDGACSEEAAIDLGPPGNDMTVANDACLRVLDGYPSWWEDRTMKLETTSNGTYPIPFSWTNHCSDSGGSGLFTGDWQSQLLSITSRECATVIDLDGSGAGNATLRYWAE